MEIVLFRHGVPKVEEGVWLTPREMARWVADYEAGGLVEQAVPEASLRAAVNLQRLVSSRAPRAVESGRLLTGNSPLGDERLREAALPTAPWPLPAAPPMLWATLFRLAWLAGWSREGESLRTARERAADAAGLLEGWARESGSLGVVGHALFNRLIARELLARGWSGPRRTATAHWGFSAYRKG